jgi:hypothetical protein
MGDGCRETLDYGLWIALLSIALESFWYIALIMYCMYIIAAHSDRRFIGQVEVGLRRIFLDLHDSYLDIKSSNRSTITISHHIVLHHFFAST